MRWPAFAGLFATWLPLLAQDPPRVDCKFCNSTGSFPCGKHGKLLDKEQPANGVRFCSAATECKTCNGALATDCRSCRNGPVEDGIAQRQQLAKEWLLQRRKAVDELTKNQPLLHLETEHVQLVFSIRPMTVGRDKVDTHPLMHLYGERMETLRTMFLELFELQPTEVPAVLKLYMFRDQQDHTLIGPRVTGIGTSSSTGVKLMGAEAVYSMWHDQRSMPDDEALHRTMVHNVTHLLLSNMAPAVWLGNRKHGWIDEGLAHWFEDKVTGKCTNFCYEEVALQPGAGFKGGRWRAPVRRLVDEGKCRSFAELATLNTDQLEFQDHAVAFAYIDFLLTTQGGGKFKDLVRRLKQGDATRDALGAVYGLNPLSIETQWQLWVKATYSPLETR